MSVAKRALVSFDGECPYYCKHCYTYGLKQSERRRTIAEIVESINNEEFDIIYISQKKENFVDPDEGLALCEALYDRYHTDLMAITRNVFNYDQIERLRNLNTKMQKEGKRFFLSVSIPALKSAYITEELSLIPSPKERIEFLHKVSDAGITSFLVIRPLYPEKIIPVTEALELIDKCKMFVSGILSSGLATNSSILKQLGYNENDFIYTQGGKSDYLVGAIEDVKYTDVSKEISILHEYCRNIGIPFFEHSLPAINYIENLA